MGIGGGSLSGNRPWGNFFLIASRDRIVTDKTESLWAILLGIATMKTVVWIQVLLVATGMASLQNEVIQQYGSVIHAGYAEALSEAKKLEKKIGEFVARPTVEGMEAAKKQWIRARLPYSQTEVARFYGGPIDDEDGFEGWINAWPIDEAYLDYVKGKPRAGLINHPDEVRGVDEETLFELNEQGGEADICTGYHAIEFLLWGQDFYPDSAGKRPLTDYTTHEFSRRRRDALQACARLLVTHLSTLVADWAPGKSNFRARFEKAPARDSLGKILTGMAMLAGFELASERLAVAYETQSQEDEHSCFSDTTHLDLIYNIKGIRNIWLGSYEDLRGKGIRDLAHSIDESLAKTITDSLNQCLNEASEIPVPFDQAFLGDDNAPGRVKILRCIESLEALKKHLVDFGRKADLGLTLN
jgi:putative iron-regulated protein